MFSINDRVVVRPEVDMFHYSETPRYSLVPVIAKLKRERKYGFIKRVDSSRSAVGVLFPGIRDLIWFKTYEVKKV